MLLLPKCPFYDIIVYHSVNGVERTMNENLPNLVISSFTTTDELLGGGGKVAAHSEMDDAPVGNQIACIRYISMICPGTVDRTKSWSTECLLQVRSKSSGMDLQSSQTRYDQTFPE